MNPRRSIGCSLNDVQYRKATVDDLDAVADIVGAQFFLDEPMTTDNIQRFKPSEAREFSMPYILHGTSVVAIDPLQNDKIVGVTLTEPTGPHTATKLAEEAKLWESKWKKGSDALKLYSYLEERANIYERYNVKKALHLDVVVVDRSMRGKSITDGMAEKCFEFAKSSGYSLITADCTSAYSQRVAEKRMQCILELPYTDYKDSSGRQIFNPPPPHTHIKKYVKIL